MTNEHSKLPDDADTELTQGWPDEPGNEELARFGAAIRSSRPALSREAMARIERAMKRKMAAGRRRRRNRWSLFPAYALSAAAAALLAVGVYLHFWAKSVRPVPPRDQTSLRAGKGGQTQPGGVQDRYRVRFASLPASPPDRPLLRLDKYQTLYSNHR